MNRIFFNESKIKKLREQLNKIPKNVKYKLQKKLQKKKIFGECQKAMVEVIAMRIFQS